MPDSIFKYCKSKLDIIQPFFVVFSLSSFSNRYNSLGYFIKKCLFEIYILFLK